MAEGLVAHNGRRFDYVILTTACKACEVLPRLSCVTGFVDSLPVFRQTFPKAPSHKQEELAHELLGKDYYNAHNAEGDVLCMSELVSHVLNTDQNSLLKKSFLPKAIIHNLESNKQKKKNMPSLTVLVGEGVLKTASAENVASSGLNYSHLLQIFKRQGEDGLRDVSTVKNIEGQPRVTDVKITLESVIPKLTTYFENLSK